jgi:hypothetical protein
MTAERPSDRLDPEIPNPDVPVDPDGDPDSVPDDGDLDPLGSPDQDKPLDPADPQVRAADGSPVEDEVLRDTRGRDADLPDER